MHFADRSRAALRRVARGAAFAAALGLAVATSSCADGFAPLSGAPAPEGLDVAAIRVDAVRLTWDPVAQDDIVSYLIERRVDLTGPFVQVAQVPQTNLATAAWIDTDVEPETFYGYRVIAATSVGDRSRPSVIGGARTPPLPGIDVSTQSLVTASEALDPDGYELLIAGPDTVRATIGNAATRRFSPLRPGSYNVSISGIIDRCAVNGAVTRSLTVTDTTATTIVPVQFQLTCRDPQRGDVIAVVNVTGDSLDPEFRFDVLGTASDATLPPSERIYSSQRTVQVAQPVTAFTNLRPGTYDVTLEDVAGNCTLAGPRTVNVPVAPLSRDTARFDISCVGSGPPPSTAKFVWRNRWSSRTPAAGSRVTLRSELDLTASATQRVQGVQAELHYNAAVLRFDGEIAGQLPNITVNGATPGVLTFLAATTPTNLRGGLVHLADFEFTVIGNAGTRSASSTHNLKAAVNSLPLQDSIRVEEDTLIVAAGGQTNTPPHAEANGPYAGVAGSPLTLSANGSGDSDGTIASYAWSFGDATSGSGSSVQKTYAAAGTYTVTLTVTDDDGATATDQATVTITASGGGANQAPTARANGPYAAQSGASFTLSSAGSSDTDGTITSYSWALGDGRTVTGAAPTVSYPNAGAYTITLTVTDDDGATATSTAQATISPPANVRPLVWQNVFGPVDVVNDLVAVTVSYDIRTDIAETPGVETLASFVVDSLKWNPALLQLYSINLGPNIVGSVNQAQASAGKLALTGTVSGAQAQGLITIATVRFRLVGAPGSRATTLTALGPLLGAASTGTYSYNAKTRVVEGELTLP